ncbi:MAG: glutamate--tRNA ligase [Thermoplasmata archaeon]|nr:glutamate--tRNA ligase [Thermoplasmata archaeon]
MSVSALELRIRRIALENAVQHDGVSRPGPILARLLATDPTLRSRSAELGPMVAEVAGRVSSLERSAQESELAALGGPEPEAPRAPGLAVGELPPLPNAEMGKVVLRLAPFPSGALHIGNARMLYLNDEYRRRYKGRLLLVFDDTIGSEEKRVDVELFDVILHDLEIAGTPPDEVFYKSDRIPHFYPWARRVIELGGAYVCICPAEVLRENRRAGRACPERAQDPPTTLDLWEKMLGGTFGPGEAVLRLRTDLADPDPAFRDRVLFRISDVEHPRVGQKYRVWPLLEFSWAVDDIELGPTHVIRGKDLVMEDRMEQHIWKLLGIHGPPFLHWGMLRVKEAAIHKSKAYREVKSGEYDGWADPRTWSIDSLERRGIQPEALRRFTLSFGLSLADIEVPAETLYAENRQIIDPTTPRRAFVADPVRVDVTGYPDDRRTVELANHPDRTELGKRIVTAGPSFYLPREEIVRHIGGEIRLKDLANIRLPAEIASEATIVRAEFLDLPNRRIPRIQWVGAEGAVDVDMLDPEGQHATGIGEAALRDAAPRDILQFERVGFVRVEASHMAGNAPVRVCFGHR